MSSFILGSGDNHHSSYPFDHQTSYPLNILIVINSKPQPSPHLLCASVSLSIES